jgi:putative oxidoreductase
MRRTSKKTDRSAASFQQDAGLLLLRLGLGLPMLLQHGLPYWRQFQEEASSFLSVFGLDARTTLVLTIAAEVGASLLMIAGLFTRAASLLFAATMAVAFVVVHGASFEGEQSGELAFLYFIGSASLIIMGPGRFSWDCYKNA